MKLPEKLPAGLSVIFSTSASEAQKIISDWLATLPRKMRREFEDDLIPHDVTGVVFTSEGVPVMVSELSNNWRAGEDAWHSMDYYAAGLQGDFVREYKEAALFTCSDIEPEGGCDFVECGQAETESAALSDSAKEQAQTDCLKFIEECAQAGIPFPIPFYALRKSESINPAHDLHYSRNGHGCGFWEEMERGESRENPDTIAGKLQKIAAGFGSKELYRGDDGKLYF